MNIESLDILSILQPELLILIPVCWGVGVLLKSIKILDNKYIPLFLAIFSVGMAFLYTFAVEGTTQVAMSIFTSIAQGIANWCIAWITYEKGIKVATQKCEAEWLASKSEECNKDEESKG